MQEMILFLKACVKKVELCGKMLNKDKYSTFLLQCFKVLSKAKCDIVPCTTREIKIELLLPIWKIYHRFLPSDSWSREGDGLEEH